MEPIVNKVAESGILTLDLTQFLPAADAVVVFDLKPFLFREMIVREKDFREALKNFDFTPFAGKHACIVCSADAIIPMWANMLAATYLHHAGASVFFGTPEAFAAQTAVNAIEQFNTDEYLDKRVVLKGCGDVSAPPEAYVAATAKLLPVVKSLMYGEPCSTVPVFKRKA